MRLYELTDEYARIMNAVSACDGELSPEVEEALAAVEGNIGQKVDGLCRLYQELQAEAKAANDEATRLAKLAGVRANAAERLKNYLKSCLEAAGLTKYETELFKVRIQSNSRPAFECVPENLPTHLQKVIVTKNDAALMDAYKAGTLPECVTATLGKHLRIS